MGARTQVKIKSNRHNDPPVYLYAHWGAQGPTLEAVRRALAHRQRWRDAEYLTRIIFCEMVRKDIDGHLSYGIGTSMHGDIEELIVVDVPDQKVRYFKNWSSNLSLSNLEQTEPGVDFEQFIQPETQPENPEEG